MLNKVKAFFQDVSCSQDALLAFLGLSGVSDCVFLQILHIALLSRLEEKEARLKESNSVGRQLQGRMFKNVISEMEERIKNSHRFDKSGTYYVLDNFLSSEHVILGRGEYDVSIVTQSSSGHLHDLTELSERWNGPISVSVFTYDDDFVNTISSLVHFHFCNDHIYRHVSFHLVYPISRAPKHLDGLALLRLSCHDHRQTYATNKTTLDGTNYAKEDLDYPNNLLRNLAINYAQTPYIFMIDIDFLPSDNLRAEFQQFMSTNPSLVHNLNTSITDQYLNTQQSLSAFVVPAFEIQHSEPVPRHKTQLLQLWLEGRVRPFYWELCQQCQQPTNYDAWRALSSGGPLSVGYTVERRSIWEPFYIARTSLPLYDERFKQYGYNRISQVCEMHIAGFKFHVLNNAFIVHKGFKVKDGFHGSKGAENRRNKQLFLKFQEELKVKYPHESKRC
ncbi:unnamed protein product [Candidula unifasciata]|uniref:Beta-1,4-glucuronyltransferase 1 n=1 Tax=Candidula unifasciata TaxID=100452 RepID=A0A8S3YXF4_9EUPU|nr:unnamed protein product [Candidula unifasciata]